MVGSGAGLGKLRKKNLILLFRIVLKRTAKITANKQTNKHQKCKLNNIPRKRLHLGKKGGCKFTSIIIPLTQIGKNQNEHNREPTTTCTETVEIEEQGNNASTLLNLS
jgi:hypothetical protein